MKNLKEVTFENVNSLFEGAILSNEMTDHFVIDCLEVRMPGHFKVFHSLHHFYPPLPGLSRMTFGEFISAEMYFSAYHESKNTNYLDLFIACLYRPLKIDFDEKSTDDRRFAFNDAKLDHYASIIQNVGQEIKMNIFYNYAAIHKWLTVQYPEVFEPAEKGKNEGGWLLIRDRLTENVKDYELTDNALLHDVLRRLNNQMKFKED